MKLYSGLDKTVVVFNNKDIDKMESCGLGYGIDILLLPNNLKLNPHIMNLIHTVELRGEVIYYK